MTPSPVPRPTKKREYVIEFASKGAEKGWRDLKAGQLNALTDAWDFLTRTRDAISASCHPLKGDLGTLERAGVRHTRWQLELHNGARIWYYISVSTQGKSAGTVHLVDVHTRHPNQTK